MSASTATQPASMDITFRRAGSVWWAIAWRMVVLSLGVGFVVGAIEGAIGVLLGMASPAIRILTALSGIVVSVPVGIYAVKLGLRKKYREFSICLLPSRL